MIHARPVTAADTPALSALFVAAGCPCFCRYLHFEGDKNDWLARCASNARENEQELEQAVRERRDDGLGVVALADGELVGWLKLAPASVARKQVEGRFYRGLPCFGGDRSGVYLLACALVRPDQRRAGVARAMVGAALELARARGARAVEALPRRTTEPVSDEELWTLPLSTLERFGLRVVGGEGPYPVLRMELV
ncbi:MAG: GNAT family N-acetyltransferase [Polyangiaceae bacterium]|nr:GNAT family N-acetyltransferase [Polyangiaceae bacterium]